MRIRFYKAPDKSTWTQLIGDSGKVIAEARGKRSLANMKRMAGV